MQSAPHRIGTCFACEPIERLKDREVGFSLAVVLHALSPSDPDRLLCIGETLEKGLHHARLADTGFTCHEGNLATSGLGFPEDLAESLQFSFSPVQHASVALPARVEKRDREGRNGIRSTQVPRFGNKAKTSSVDRLDDSRLVGVVV